MKAPRFPSFFKTPKYKQFEMPVRYYNERKERIQKAKDRAKMKRNGNLDKGHFSGSWKKRSTMGDRTSSVRVSIILTILCLIAYWILKF